MKTKFNKIEDIGDIKGKRIIVRLDLNVPIINGEVRDDFRIKSSLPTLQFLKDKGARVIVISHIESEERDSLEIVSKYISNFIKVKSFIKKIDEAKVVVNSMQEGELVIFENLRLDPGEKNNDINFAKKIADLGELFVNDAFAVSHRKHASIVSLPKLLPSFAGFLMAKEIENLSEAFNPVKPFLFILGGAKFSTKLPLVNKFLEIADNVFVGGALANDIFKSKGLEIGQSLVTKDFVDLQSIIVNQKLVTPIDVVVFDGQNKTEKDPSSVLKSDNILDAGAKTISMLEKMISESSFVLWNGPVGDYEKGFSLASEKIAKAIIDSDAKSVIGGGDTVALVSKCGFLDKFSFVSTGGGAMLDFLAEGTLPGIEALQ